MSAKRVPDIRVKLQKNAADPRSLEDLPSNHPECRTVRTIVDRALEILEQGRGRVALKSTAIDLVIMYGSESIYPNDDRQKFKHMGKYLDIFLGAIRNYFPQIVLKTTSHSEASVARKPLNPNRTIPLEEYQEYCKKRQVGTMKVNYSVSYANPSGNILLDFY